MIFTAKTLSILEAVIIALTVWGCASTPDDWSKPPPVEYAPVAKTGGVMTTYPVSTFPSR